MTTRQTSLRPSIFLATTGLVLNCLLANAQDMPKQSGPIDIQADEQEFAQDHVIARGKVRVLYGDTTIRAPMATLYRDEAGSPKQAVFTGSPVLSQGSNIIKAAKLTFNVKEATIIAEGHAHSEVLTSSMGNTPPPAAPPPTPDTGKKNAGKKGKGKGGTKGGDGIANLIRNAETEEQLKAETATADTGKDAAADSADSADAAKTDTASGGEAPKAMIADKPPQRIVTDSDKQEFDRNTGKFEAMGHVHVATGDIDVDANHLKLVYGTDGKPEAVVFTGEVAARRDKNETHADIMTYFLTTQRLQASGHVRSRVVQEKTSAAPSASPLAGLSGIDGGAAYAAAPKQIIDTKILDTPESSGPDIITIISDSQDYSKSNGRMDAAGNCRVYYKDTIGFGPKITLVNNETGQADRVIFIGRSQISQPGRRWIGDRITMLVADRRVLAEGNTRAIIVKGPGAMPSMPSSRPQAAPAAGGQSRLASTPAPRKRGNALAGENKTR